MELQPKAFVLTWLLTCILVATAVAAFDALTDPYMLFEMPRIEGFNARKPAAATQERLIKAYDVLRNRSNTLALGTSRVDLGIDSADPAWPSASRPVYNLAISGGGPYLSYRYLQHVMTQRPVATVVLGLDFEFFLSAIEADRPASDDLESRLAVAPNGSVNSGQSWRYFLDIIQSTVSLEALEDSFATVAANFDPVSFDISAGTLAVSPLSHWAQIQGAYPAVVATDLTVIRHYLGKHENELVMSDVRAILDLCKLHGTRMILFISPVHADTLDILDMLGDWHAYEDWKRKLLTLTLQYSRPDGSSQVPLWDFSGYDSYSTEEVPRTRRPLQWFWDSFHYNRAMGTAIVSRLFESGDPHFGVLLSPDILESHLMDIREQQRAYRASHPEAVRRIHYLYDSVVGSHSRNTAVAGASPGSNTERETSRPVEAPTRVKATGP